MNAHYLANLQALIPTLASFWLPIIVAAKVGMKSCRFVRKCVHASMDVTTQLELCFH